MWSAAWLYKATGDEDFLQQAESKVESLGDQKEFSWDNKAPGAWVSTWPFRKLKFIVKKLTKIAIFIK